MRSRGIIAALVLALATLVTGVALAQHHRRHRRHNDGHVASSDVDAGIADAVATDAGVDARVGPSHGPTRGGGDRGGGGAPEASCPERWRATTSTNDRAGGANVCDSTSDCTIAPAVCCMPCDGSPIRGQDVVAITGNAAQSWSEALCTSEDTCRHCPFQPGAELRAQCDDGRCTVYERVPCH